MARELKQQTGRDVTIKFYWAAGQADHSAAYLAPRLRAILVSDDSDGPGDLGAALEIIQAELDDGVVVFGALRDLSR